MKPSTVALLIFLAIGLFGLIMSIVTIRPVSVLDYTGIILKSDSTYYYLGRNAGTLAHATLELRRIRTGRDFSTNELYALADSMSDFHAQIEIDRQILQGAK